MEDPLAYAATLTVPASSYPKHVTHQAKKQGIAVILITADVTQHFFVISTVFVQLRLTWVQIFSASLTSVFMVLCSINVTAVFFFFFHLIAKVFFYLGKVQSSVCWPTFSRAWSRYAFLTKSQRHFLKSSLCGKHARRIL